MLEELAGLASMFPLIRPDCQEFDAWLDAQDGTEITKAMVEEGGNLLSPAERDRIAHAHAEEFPEVWRSLVDDLGDEAEAEQIVLIGAIAAALHETRTIDPDVLDLIEEQADELEADPADLLALALDASDLWSIAEATIADEALAGIPDFLDDHAYEVRWNATIEVETARSWSPRHERRLARLVRRLHARLKFVERARASDLMSEACAVFERDESVRRKLAALLLADSAGLLLHAKTSQALAA